MTTEKNHPASESIVPSVLDPAGGEVFAWKVHGALQDWIAKVDTKASIVMTLETAVLSGIVAFSAWPTTTYPHAWLWWLHKSGLILLFTSVVLAGAVVFPQLRGREITKSQHHGMIYFGHLRQWRPEELADTLAIRESGANLLMLSTQLVIVSRIAWVKHVLVQWSLLIALVGCIAVGIPLVIIT